MTIPPVAAPPFDRAVLRVEPVRGASVNVMVADDPAEDRVVHHFGAEWSKCRLLPEQDLRTAGAELFDMIPPSGHGLGTMLDLGCGNGRWVRYLEGRFTHIDALDPSSAVHKAAEVHADLAHVRWVQGRGEDLPFGDEVYDMVVCTGVLHHVPDPTRVLNEIRRVLRPGGLLYFYMYYAMEQRSAAYRGLHKASELLRHAIHPLPAWLRLPLCDLLAVLIYLPLVSIARLLKRMGIAFWRRMPLAYYCDKSFRVMRNDALDRFGTPFEARSTREEIIALMSGAGLTDVRFSEGPPYWHGTAMRAT